MEALNWFDQQENDALYLSVVSVAEIRYGLNILPRSFRTDVDGENLHFIPNIVYKG